MPSLGAKPEVELELPLLTLKPPLSAAAALETVGASSGIAVSCHLECLNAMPGGAMAKIEASVAAGLGYALHPVHGILCSLSVYGLVLHCSDAAHGSQLGWRLKRSMCSPKLPLSCMLPASLACSYLHGKSIPHQL